MNLRGTLTDARLSTLPSEEAAIELIEGAMPGWSVSNVESISHLLIETTTWTQSGQSFIPGAMSVEFYAHREDI